MKKRILETLLMVITTVSLVASILGEVGIKNVYAKEGNCTIYHKHTGTSSSGGGCYTGITYCNGYINTITEELKCGAAGSIISQTQWRCAAGHIDYNSVDEGWYDYPHDSKCTVIVGTRNYYKCATCNATYSNNPGRCTAIKSYSLQCNKDEATPLATIACSTSTDEWSSNVILSAQVSVLDSNYSLSSTPYIWNGSSSSESTYTVTKNGSYSLELAGNDNTSQAKIDFTISNIDSVGPSIQSISYSTQESTSDFVTVKIVAIDEGGSGLADNAYSFDGGNTWVSSSENSFSSNGNYKAVVKDKAGNQVSGIITITNIVKPTNTENTGNTGNTTSTTTNANPSSSNAVSSSSSENSPQSSNVNVENSNASTQTISSQKNSSQATTQTNKTNTSSNDKKNNTEKNSKTNSKTNSKSTNTKTSDSSVSGNSTRFVPYIREKNETETMEESTTISQSELLVTNDAKTLDTLSNNSLLGRKDNSLLSILFSVNMIKTILIVLFGTFICVFVILFFKKKNHAYHRHQKH